MPNLEKVQLIKDHTHAEREHTAGESIMVTASEKAWLEENEIISKSAAAVSRKATATAATTEGDEK